MSTATVWTPCMAAIVRRGWARGTPVRVIADELRVRPHQVVCKARLMQLGPHPAPNRPDPPPGTVRKHSEPARRHDPRPAYLRGTTPGAGAGQNNRPPLPAGHPVAWSILTAGTLLDGVPYPEAPGSGAASQPHGECRG